MVLSTEGADKNAIYENKKQDTKKEKKEHQCLLPNTIIIARLSDYVGVSRLNRNKRYDLLTKMTQRRREEVQIEV